MKRAELSIHGCVIALIVGLSLALSQAALAQEEVPPGVAKQERIPGEGSHKGWEQGKHKGWEKQKEKKEEIKAKREERKAKKEELKERKKEKKEERESRKKREANEEKREMRRTSEKQHRMDRDTEEPDMGHKPDAGHGRGGR